jgi:hypothetical protein
VLLSGTTEWMPWSTGMTPRLRHSDVLPRLWRYFLAGVAPCECGSEQVAIATSAIQIKNWRGESGPFEMAELAIGGRSFVTPVLVPSVSSFETQLPPADGLRLQTLLGEPISLVSAFDLHKNDDLKQAAKEFRQLGILLVDSGGYESSRISKYNKISSEDWNKKIYLGICKEEEYDFILGFDYFLRPNESPREYEERIIAELNSDRQEVPREKYIPVLHLKSEDGKARLKDNDAIRLFSRVVHALSPQFVAIPERELGAGILKRAELVRLLVKAGQRTRPDMHLHVLGCGNLLSFSFLAVAGAMIFDGLEWCRTYAAENFHLHHFQQRDLFQRAYADGINPSAEFLLTQNLSYDVDASVRNLLGFQRFGQLLHQHLADQTVSQLVGQLFGERAGKALARLEQS